MLRRARRSNRIGRPHGPPPAGPDPAVFARTGPPAAPGAAVTTRSLRFLAPPPDPARLPLPPVPRARFAAGTDACDHCTGRCCGYFALPIEEPTTAKDFGFLRWYLLHGNCAVFVDSGNWYLQVYGDCEHLRADHRCGIYEDRPDICRAYSNEACEYDGDGRHDRLFECAEQIDEYAEAVLPRKQRRPRAAPQPPTFLPVLNIVPHQPEASAKAAA